MAAPATERYVTADFSNAPLLALADLMGLGQYKEQIGASPEIYTSILNGIAVFRHLEAADRISVNRLIHNNAHGMLLQKLIGLVADQSVQHFWFMWSLSDEELLDFYSFSKNKLEFTSQFNPVELPDVTVLGVAGAVYGMSKQGPRAYAREKIGSLKNTELFEAVAERLGFAKKLAAGIGIVSVPTIIVISGLNIMAKGEHDKARRELAARGLLVYSEL
ncbi:hypothetical protein ACFOZ5_01180 [Marinobacter lacisalsi]|uniref:Uncharacterized protein n=1 Tax=Marinobacter lacisalsi TaxID=475979 RepID=A0ABV8QDW8_9GAMM